MNRDGDSSNDIPAPATVAEKLITKRSRQDDMLSAI